MGSDKALVTLAGERLIDRTVRRTGTLGWTVMLSAGQDFGTGLPVIPDRLPGFAGPGHALLGIAEELHRRHPALSGFATLAVDTPFFPADMLERLSRYGHCRYAASPGGAHPTCGFWQIASLRGAAAQVPPDWNGSLRGLIAVCGAAEIRFPDNAAFMNINTAEDLARAEQLLLDSDKTAAITRI